MKKRTVALLTVMAVCVVCVGLFTGCSGSSDEEETVESMNTSDMDSEQPDSDTDENADTDTDAGTGTDTDLEKALDEMEETAGSLTAEDSVSQEAARVESIDEDGVLTLVRYVLKESETDYKITDYTSVDFDKYEELDGTREYTLEESTPVFVVEEDGLSELSADEIRVGDMLITCEDNDGVPAIAVYHMDEAGEE